MLVDIDLTLKNTLAFRIDGAISTQDMKYCQAQLQQLASQQGETNLYEEIPHCSSVEITALSDKLRYLQQQPLKQKLKLKRVAIVSDQHRQQSSQQLSELLLGNTQPEIDIRSFALSEKKQALAFLQAPVSA